MADSSNRSADEDPVSITCDRFFIGLAGFSSPTGAKDLSRALTDIAEEHRAISELVHNLPEIMKINVAKQGIEPERFDSLPRTLNNLPEDINELRAGLAAAEPNTGEYVKQLLHSARYLAMQGRLLDEKISSGRLELLNYIDSPEHLEELSERIRALIQKIEMLPKSIAHVEEGIAKFAKQIERLPDTIVAGFNPDHWPPWQVMRCSIEQKDQTTATYRIAIPHLLFVGPDVDARTPSIGPEIPAEWELPSNTPSATQRTRARNRSRQRPNSGVLT